MLDLGSNPKTLSAKTELPPFKLILKKSTDFNKCLEIPCICSIEENTSTYDKNLFFQSIFVAQTCQTDHKIDLN